MKKMTVLGYFILSLLIFSQASQCLNVIKFNEHISLERVNKDPFLQISITESLLQSEQDNQIHNFEFFVIKSVSRHKNKTYLKLLKNYEKLVNILIQKLIIGDQRLLIKSKIKQKYLKKKRLWEFGIMFMIQGQTAEIEQLYHFISQLGVSRLNTKPKTKTLNQRIIASNAFYKLKRKICKQLSRSPELSIKKIINVKIHGFSIPNSISLDRKNIQYNFEQVREARNEEMSFLSDYFFHKAHVPKQSKSVTLKATFQIGEDNQQQIDLESQDSQFQSQSDDEEGKTQDTQNLEDE